ncbi:MAG: uncharacterized protein K0Q49_2493 [Haloplasmataceae bacterium]|jgi:integrase|nr:uncharacterized protein [Haloplasmataceae bacterium]
MGKIIFNSFLKDIINEFVEYKKTFGYKYESGSETFKTFDNFCLKYSYDSICLPKALVEDWLVLKPGEKKANQQNKASIVRQLGKYMFIQGYDAYIVPLLPIRGEPKYMPYIFSHNEILSLISIIDNYSTHTPETLPSTRNTMKMVFRILYGCGMRVGEVLNLRIKDVDLNSGIISVIEAKNDNKRLIPMSESLRLSCVKYRNELPLQLIDNEYFFPSGGVNNKYDRSTVYYYFRNALKQMGIKHRGRGYGPRVHDLRHTFAVHSLSQLSQLGKDTNSLIVALSTYLGHKSIFETQHYLWLTPDLFKNDLTKMEKYTAFIYDEMELFNDEE